MLWLPEITPISALKNRFGTQRVSLSLIHISLTTDGKASAYKHGEVTIKHSSISVLSIDPEELPEESYGETNYELLSDGACGLAVYDILIIRERNCGNLRYGSTF